MRGDIPRFNLPAIRSSRAIRSNVISVMSPEAGLNTRDNLADLKIDEAQRLDNWFPCFDCVRVREGYTSFVATGLGSGSVETLAEYRSGPTHKFIAGANGSLYDITSGTASNLGSGYSANRWQWVNFDGKLGLVNGTDAGVQYNGTTVSPLNLSSAGGGSLPSGQPVGLAGHRSRVYYWWNNSQSLWYTALNAIGGQLTEFNLSRVGQFGGEIVAVSSATVGGEAGDFAGGGIAEDLLVIHFSSGDIAVYQGSIPASDFVLVGVYRAGTPVDPRTVAKVGDDLVLLTSDGASPLSQILRVGRFTRTRTLTQNIRPTVIQAIANNSGNAGWEMIYWPKGQWFLINVPLDASRSFQFVSNIEKGSWCTFGLFNSPMHAATWGIFDDDLFWGSHDGKVYRIAGSTDNGQAIVAAVRQAPNTFGPAGRNKLIKALRPQFQGNGDYDIGVSIESDFKLVTPSTNQIAQEATGLKWEDWTDKWEESTLVWGDMGGTSTFGDWIARDARGYHFNVHIQVSTTDPLKWFNTDFRVQNGVGI